MAFTRRACFRISYQKCCGIQSDSQNKTRILEDLLGLRIESEHLHGVVVLVPDVFQDHRGQFTETFRADFFKACGLPAEFVQDNESRSARGVIRGLHFQWEPPMGKLMRVSSGCAFLVAVDIRKGSPTFGQWFGIEASGENRLQVWAPAGFARGFCALSESAQVLYKCTGLHNSAAESAILWSDPALAIPWPAATPILSEKDRNAQTLAQWIVRAEAERFKYEDGEAKRVLPERPHL